MTTGSILQGSIGIGLAIISAPILLMVEPVLVPGPLLLCAVCLTAIVAFREREFMDRSKIGWALVGRMPGTLVGLALLSAIPTQQTSVFLAGMLLFAVVLSGIGRAQWKPRPLSLTVAGWLSGIMGTTTSVGGPPMALLFVESSGSALRGTLSGFFFVGASVSSIGLALTGRLGWTELCWAASLLPAVVLGTQLSRYTARILARKGSRGAVLIASGTAATVALVRSCFGY